VVVGMRAVAKLFIGDIIESARRIQGEWIEKTGEIQSDAPVKGASPAVVANGTPQQQQPSANGTTASATQSAQSATDGTSAAVAAGETTPAVADKEDNPDDAGKDKEGTDKPEKDDRRGPLRPEHLREAIRRYKLGQEGGGVGMQQLWHLQQQNGVDRFPTRTGGRRIFR